MSAQDLVKYMTLLDNYAIAQEVKLIIQDSLNVFAHQGNNITRIHNNAKLTAHLVKLMILELVDAFAHQGNNITPELVNVNAQLVRFMTTSI